MRGTPRRGVCFLAGYCTRKGHVAGNHDVQIRIVRTHLYMTYMAFVLRSKNPLFDTLCHRPHFEATISYSSSREWIPSF